MDVKYFTGLFEGDDANGVKLGMGLTGGDFWPRVDGCRNLYRGEDLYYIDFDTLIAVSDFEAGQIFSTLNHMAATAYYYSVREVNGCGDEQQGLGAVVKAAFDSEGDLIQGGCNDLYAIWARQVAGRKVRIEWRYCPLNQEDACSEFKVYCDDWTSKVLLGTVEYAGGVCYAFETGTLIEGRYRFSVVGVTADGIEGRSAEVDVEVVNTVPAGVGALRIKVE